MQLESGSEVSAYRVIGPQPQHASIPKSFNTHNGPHFDRLGEYVKTGEQLERNNEDFGWPGRGIALRSYC